MAIKLNWDRVKQLHADLESDGWNAGDKLLFILMEKGGKAVKSVVCFKDLMRFCWDMSDNEDWHVLSFLIQDTDGKVLYRHRKIVGNEEVPIGGNMDLIAHWSALTDDEKQTFITMLAAQIDAYER